LAAKTPVAAGTAGYVDKVRGVYTGVRGSTEALIAVGTVSNTRNRYRQMVFYFDNIDDGDTWASGIQNIKAVFWSGDAEAGDACNAVLTVADGTITFETVATSDVNGWVLLFIDDQDPAHGMSQI
jgi:hypothetical protein